MHSTSGGSAKSVVEGNDDLLTKILLLLPAKPLFRSKLVSKRWLSLISDPCFSSSWSLQSVPTALIFSAFVEPFDQYVRYCYIPLNLKDETSIKGCDGVLDFVKKDPSYDVQVLSCCGGLILCRCVKTAQASMLELDYYPVVCNPTTKQFTVLPKPKLISMGMTLAFEQSGSPDFKVVSAAPPRFQIYSSRENSWTRSTVEFPMSYIITFRPGVFFNGAVFWIAFTLDVFFYLDIERDVRCSGPMPKLDEMQYCGCIHEHLYLVGTLDAEWPKVRIFELDNDCSSWSLKYHIDILEITRTPHEITKVFSVIAREGNQEPYLALRIQCEVILISLKDNSCSKLLSLDASVDESLSSYYVCGVHENPFWSLVYYVCGVHENPFWM